jgi:transcription-repair coupling factor (superfamily II helicase)
MNDPIKAQGIEAQGIRAQGIKVWGAPEGWDAFLLAQRRREHSGNVLHVTRDDARMARLAEALAFVMPEAEVLRFPAWDCLPYDRVSPNPALVSERIATLGCWKSRPARGSC